MDESNATAVNSAAGVIVRAAVMIACLVAVPLAAMIGRGAQGEAPRDDGIEARPPVQPVAPPPTPDPAATPPVETRRESPAAADQQQRLQRLPPIENETRLSAPPSASLWNPSPDAPVERAVRTVEFRDPVLASDGARRADAVPPERQAGDARKSGGWGHDLAALQQRLRALGADYCRLESGGADGAVFRYVCRVRAGGPDGEARVFEATDGAPERAMNAVVEQVEAWRRDRGATGPAE